MDASNPWPEVARENPGLRSSGHFGPRIGRISTRQNFSAVTFYKYPKLHVLSAYASTGFQPVWGHLCSQKHNVLLRLTSRRKVFFARIRLTFHRCDPDLQCADRKVDLSETNPHRSRVKLNFER
jgi:hypothetical protein